VVERCLTEGLVGGEGFALDASLIAADANKQRSIPGGEWTAQDHGTEASRAVQEYLATLDEAAWGAATDVEPKFVSPSDPAAQWTGAIRGPAFFAYSTNYLIDTQHAVILDVEATRAIRQAEVGAARTMLERTAERFGLNSRLRAALYMAAVVATKLNPHIKAQQQRLLERGKAKMSTLGAAMRKLVHICFGVLKSGNVYQFPGAHRT
jgi:hypothetical protein